MHGRKPQRLFEALRSSVAGSACDRIPAAGHLYVARGGRVLPPRGRMATGGSGRRRLMVAVDQTSDRFSSACAKAPLGGDREKLIRGGIDHLHLFRPLQAFYKIAGAGR